MRWIEKGGLPLHTQKKERKKATERKRRAETRQRHKRLLHWGWFRMQDKETKAIFVSQSFCQAVICRKMLQKLGTMGSARNWQHTRKQPKQNQENKKRLIFPNRTPHPIFSAQNCEGKQATLRSTVTSNRHVSV